jgi:predicted CoA-binding protein
MTFNEDFKKKAKIIAIIGLSDKKERPSYQVANYFISEGFEIIPVNPNIKTVFGLKSYPNFKSIPKNIKIDIVDIFRKSDEIVDIVKEIVETKRKPIIWLQEGVISPEAEKLAKQNKLKIISNFCLMKFYRK